MHRQHFDCTTIAAMVSLISAKTPRRQLQAFNDANHAKQSAVFSAPMLITISEVDGT